VQITASPARIVTADQNEDAQLITQLRSQLATLELKRTELLGRFEPGYRPLKDIEAQMAELGREIKADEQTPVRKITTDNNPTALLVSGELAKAKADLASATARSIALQRTVERYRNSAFELRDREFQEQDLVRVAKAKEQAYLLYLNKRDEARISDALDSKHIVNVALAEAPTVPYFALHSRRWILLVGLCAAVLLSTIAVVGSEMTDHRLYTPREIEACLELPVLAALPRADQVVEGRSA
jgi:uncharacterized protein involved in exopolysaccharide biosynthesis